MRNASASNILSTENNTGNFAECISALAKNLEERPDACEQLQDLFFKLANSEKFLPENSTIETIDNFLNVLITLIFRNQGQITSLKGLTILLNYIRNDNKVFERFVPDNELIVKLGE